MLDDVAHHFFKGFGHCHTVKVHAGRVCLHHGGMVVHVDNQSGQVIALTVYQTVGIVLRIAQHAQGTAEVFGHLQAAYPERVVDGFLTEGKHTHGDASNLEMSAGNEFFLGGVDIYYFTFFRLSFHTGDGSGKTQGWKRLSDSSFPGLRNTFL